jgi:hypothetical protein
MGKVSQRKGKLGNPAQSFFGPKKRPAEGRPVKRK